MTLTTRIVEVEKVAMSEGPFGTVWGDQLVAVFQELPPGLLFHVALPASAAVRARKRNPKKKQTRMAVGIWRGGFMGNERPVE